MAKHRRKQHDCPNCGTPLAPEFEFCPACGQENHELKVPFRHMAYEFVEGITHFDAKVWNTLRSMATPGRITQEFLVGKRARYVPPVRLYIFVSVVFFFLLNALMNHRMRQEDTPERRSELQALRARADSLGTVQQHVGLKATVQQGDSVRQVDDGYFSIVYTLSDSEKTRLAAHLGDITNEQLDSVLVAMGNPGSNWFRRRLLVALLHIPSDEEGMDYLAHLTTRSLSLLMFLLMPFFALLLKVLFARKRLYYEHLIFSIHTHTAFFILLSAISALGLVLYGPVQDWIVRLTWLGALVYLLFALRRVFHRSWFATVALSLVLAIPYFIAFIVLSIAGIMFGFLLY